MRHFVLWVAHGNFDAAVTVCNILFMFIRTAYKDFNMFTRYSQDFCSKMSHVKETGQEISYNTQCVFKYIKSTLSIYLRQALREFQKREK